MTTLTFTIYSLTNNISLIIKLHKTLTFTIYNLTNNISLIIKLHKGKQASLDLWQEILYWCNTLLSMRANITHGQTLNSEVKVVSYFKTEVGTKQ